MHHWPQIAMYAFCAVGLLLAAYMHGKPRTGKHSFWVTAVSFAIQYGVMWAGGFFSVSK